jgi:hypothetical protein
VLENHHISTAFKIMQRPNCNILESFSGGDYSAMRKLMIDMVISTDMSKHAHFLGEFKSLVTATHKPASSAAAAAAAAAGGVLGAPFDSGRGGSREGADAARVRPAGSISSAEKVASSLAASYEKRALVLCTIIHCVGEYGLFWFWRGTFPFFFTFDRAARGCRWFALGQIHASGTSQPPDRFGDELPCTCAG